MSERRSAKSVVEDFANEILRRPKSPEQDNYLTAIMTIANRMGWDELHKKIKFREQPPLKWYQRDDL